MKLKNQLVLIYFPLLIVTVLILSIVFFFSSKKTITNQIHHHLESVSELKKQRVLRLIQNNNERLSLTANHPVLAIAVRQFLSTGNQNIKATIIKSLKNNIEDIQTFKSIHILSTDRKIILSTDSTSLSSAIFTSNNFKLALKGIKTTDGFYLRKNGDLGIYLIAPLIHSNKIIAILIIESDGENFDSIFCNYTGMGKTGETTLSKRLPNGKVLFITPLRFDRRAALRKTIPYDSTIAAVVALSNKEGLFDNVRDYRNKEVIAVTRYIPETGWGIVTKIDKDEALEPLTHIRNGIFIVSLVTGIIALIIIWLFGNYITQPIVALTFYAKKLIDGDLSQRIKIIPHNEIGILAKSFNELTDRLQTANEETKITLTQLKESNKALNDFAYTISHDLKSPLATIEGLIIILEDEIENKKTEEHLHLLLLIKQKVHNMNEMIVNVLEYAKAGTSVTAQKTYINVGYLAKEILSTINPPENIQIVLKDLPDVYYPKIALVQVLQNIIGNAVKYMDKPEGMIIIGCNDVENFWEFYISDNGPGIEEKDFDKIFMMLKSVTKSNIVSSGIGLATAKKIIHENGGSIWVQSSPGKGTTFYFTIPKA